MSKWARRRRHRQSKSYRKSIAENAYFQAIIDDAKAGLEFINSTRPTHDKDYLAQ